jgi:hypothetical protein
VASPLAPKINPTRHCTTGASIRQANLQPLQAPTNLGLSLQHHCCPTGLVQLPRRCQPRHASADDDNINNSIGRRAASKLSRSADHHSRPDQSCSTIHVEPNVLAFFAQVSPYSNSLGVANCLAADHRPGAAAAGLILLLS